MGNLIRKFAKILWGQNFSYICWGINLHGGSKNYMGGVIFITTLSLFHFFRNSQHPEKRSVSFKNFFRKCACIRSCYLPISSNSLIQKSFRKTSLLVLTLIGVMEKSDLLAACFKLLL